MAIGTTLSYLSNTQLVYLINAQTLSQFPLFRDQGGTRSNPLSPTIFLGVGFQVLTARTHPSLLNVSSL